MARNWSGIIVCYLVLSFTSSAAVGQMPTVDQFANASGIEGQSIRLFCRVTNQGLYGVYWYLEQQGDLVLGLETSHYLRNQPRYTIEADRSGGYYNLTVNDLRLSDAGRYECLMSDGQNTVNGVPGTVEVLPPIAPPEGPSCLTRHHEPLSEGDEISLTCLAADGGRPESLLMWYDDLGARTGSGGAGPNQTVTLRATPADNGGVYTCKENHLALDEPRLCTVGPLMVFYAPVVTILPSSTQAEVGEMITWTCSGDANPQVESLRWVFGNESLTPVTNFSLNSSQSRLIIQEVENPDGKLQSHLIIADVKEADYTTRITCIASSPNSTRNTSVMIQRPNPSTTTQPPDDGIANNPILLLAVVLSALGGTIVFGLLCLLIPHLRCLVCESCRRRRRKNQREKHRKRERKEKEPEVSVGTSPRSNVAFEDDQTTARLNTNNNRGERAGRLQSISSKSTISSSRLSNCVVEMDNTISSG